MEDLPRKVNFHTKSESWYCYQDKLSVVDRSSVKTMCYLLLAASQGEKSKSNHEFSKINQLMISSDPNAVVEIGEFHKLNWQQ